MRFLGSLSWFVVIAPLALVASSLGAVASGCGLDSAVDEVLQSPDDPRSEVTGSSTSSSGAASGGGGGGSGSGSGASSSGSSGVGGNTGAEDCTDGVDNDGDGQPDCADSDCAPGFECVEAAPDGLGGLYRAEKAAPGGKVACADGSSPDVYVADPAGPAQCAACTCSDVMGATCQPPSIGCTPNSTICGIGQQDWTSPLNAAACNKPALPVGAFALSCMLTGAAQVLENGKCQASVSDFPNKEAWGSDVSACAVGAVGGGCGGAKACVPKAPAGTPASVCVRLDGTKVCPAGFAKVIPAFKGGTDTRGCAACACGDSKTMCSGGSYSFYDLNSCMAGAGTDPNIEISSNQCSNVTPLLDQGSWSVAPIAPKATGGCAPSGGQPTGQLSTDGPVTFCCQ